MQIPLQVDYRHLTGSPAIEQAIDKHVAHLQRFDARILGCRVTVEAPPRHQLHGAPYEVRVRLTVPGTTLIASSGGRDPAHADLYVAIRDAFDAASRRLEDHVRVVRGDVKTHAMPAEPEQ